MLNRARYRMAPIFSRCLFSTSHAQTERKATPGILDKMLHASEPILSQIYNHDFIKRLADGSLPLEVFEIYTIQDTKFLIDSAKMFMHLEKRRDINEKDADLLNIIRRNTVQLELSPASTGPLIFNHKFDPPVAKSPVIEAYTNFLLKNATHEAPAVALACMLPCFHIYKNIGAQLSDVDQEALHSLYKNWIKVCSDADYLRSTAAMIELVEKHAAASPALHPLMVACFKQASAFELAFFEECFSALKLQHTEHSLNPKRLLKR